MKSDLTSTIEGEAGSLETEVYEDAVVAMDAQEDDRKVNDAISALVNLGYQKTEAYRAVNLALKNQPDADVSALIRLALKEFATKEL